MDRPRRSFSFAALTALAFALGCAGPPIPAPIEGLPVCPDFTTGGAKMEGGLRYPVRLRVLDGKTVVYNTVLSGLRHAGDPRPKTFITDYDAHYQVEWGQCENPRAPRSASEPGRAGKAHETPRDREAVGYDCGKATVYKSEGLVTRKGDRASHVITFSPPPDASCWAAEVAPVAPPVAADRGAPVTDAGAATDAGAMTDAGATSDAG